MSHSYTDTILNETLAPSDTRAVEVQVDQYNLLEIDNIEEFNGYLRQDRRTFKEKVRMRTQPPSLLCKCRISC